MEYKGKGKLEVGKSLYESVTISISNMDLEDVALGLSPMEQRCSQCHNSLTNEDITLFIAHLKILENPSPKFHLPNNVFLIHKKCLEEFISGYLNSQDKTEQLPGGITTLNEVT